MRAARSEGLFDFADFLSTVMSLAGVPGAKLADPYPKTTYVDGVDQASFFGRQGAVGPPQSPVHAEPVLRHDARG